MLTISINEFCAVIAIYILFFSCVAPARNIVAFIFFCSRFFSLVFNHFLHIDQRHFHGGLVFYIHHIICFVGIIIDHPGFSFFIAFIHHHTFAIFTKNHFLYGCFFNVSIFFQFFILVNNCSLYFIGWV